MKTDDKILIEALRILSRDIVSQDGVANAAIAEGADRLEELVRIVDGLNGTIESMQQTNDALIGKLNAEKL